MTILFLALWLQMSAQPVTRVTMYESMCRLPRVEYGERYHVIVGADECFIFERNIGEVYWSGPHGQAILFPIGSPLDDITRAEFAHAAQRAADETDGKLPPGTSMLPVAWPEPVDVPAVQETEDTSDTWWTVPSTGPADVQVKGVQRRWTCTDKSRVLLTSEDGKKHCIKF